MYAGWSIRNVKFQKMKMKVFTTLSCFVYNRSLFVIFTQVEMAEIVSYVLTLTYFIESVIINAQYGWKQCSSTLIYNNNDNLLKYFYNNTWHYVFKLKKK